MLSISRKHIRTSKLVLAATLGVALVLGLSLSNVSYAQDAESDESLGSSASYAAARIDDPEADVSEPMQAAIEICFYSILGDNPHLSSSFDNNEVSAHGGWKADSPETCPERGDVTTELYARRCTGIFCWWSWLSSQTRTVRSGGTRGRRATARHHCVSNATTRFQSVVDVDLPGVIEAPIKKRSAKAVDCRPWWD